MASGRPPSLLHQQILEVIAAPARCRNPTSFGSLSKMCALDSVIGVHLVPEAWSWTESGIRSGAGWRWLVGRDKTDAQALDSGCSIWGMHNCVGEPFVGVRWRFSGVSVLL